MDKNFAFELINFTGNSNSLEYFNTILIQVGIMLTSLYII